MSSNLIRLVIKTNTNLRFIVSLPNTIVIRDAFPLILKKYKTVIAENLD
jgi:hypothetical protein